MCALVGNICVAIAPPPLHDRFTDRGRGRVARIAHAERGAEGQVHCGGGACSPPHHISVCAQPFTPALSTWRAPHMGTRAGGTWANGEGGGGTQVRAAQDRRKGGAHANTVCGAPPSSGAWGKGSSPLCMWQTGGSNRRWHVQGGGGVATGEG